MMNTGNTVNALSTGLPGRATNQTYRDALLGSSGHPHVAELITGPPNEHNDHYAYHISQYTGAPGPVPRGSTTAPATIARRLLTEGRLLGTVLKGDLRVKHARGTGPGRHALQRAFRGDPFPLKKGCVVKFDVKFEPGFEWGCRGKIGGLRIGPGNADGGEYSRDGASLRVMWDAGGGAYAYVYVPQGTHRLQPGPLSVKKKHGAEVFKEAFEDAFRGGDWHTITLGVKLNTMNKGSKPNADGVLLIGIGKTQRQLDNVVWRVHDAIDVDRFVLGVFHGGPCRATRTSFSNYRNVRVYDW